MHTKVSLIIRCYNEEKHIGRLLAGLGRGHLASIAAEEGVDELAAKHPLGRVGDPQEIAQSILFLADSSKSGFMTGQSLVVDGGVLAKLASE